MNAHVFPFAEALREPTLDEELRAMGEDEIVEMVNLRESDTGLAGTIFVSTIMGGHGPRVKYYLKAGRHQPSLSLSIEAEPRLLASSLPPIETRRVAPTLLEWVRANHEALLAFWYEGETMSVQELAAFTAGLVRVK